MTSQREVNFCKNIFMPIKVQDKNFYFVPLLYSLIHSVKDFLVFL